MIRKGRLRAVKKMVNYTGKGAIKEIGSFGACSHSPGKDMALIASTDGVGRN